MDDFAADPSHPRYASLLMRHRLEVAEKRGMLAGSAMIAHGVRFWSVRWVYLQDQVWL